MRRAAFAILFLLLAGMLSVPSCGNQGEGERCDINAGGLPGGTDDCNAGLQCTPADQLRWPVRTDGGIAMTPNTPICCPPPGMPATAEVCKNITPSIGSDAAIMDGDMTSEAASDAPTETSSSDAPSDSPTDTSSDAPTDATGQ